MKAQAWYDSGTSVSYNKCTGTATVSLDIVQGVNDNGNGQHRINT